MATPGVDGRIPKHVTIGDVWIDVSIHETHGVSADVTDHPVETGANMVDHIVPQARTFSIEGLITNHPIEVPQSHKGNARESTSPIELQVARSLPKRVPPSSVMVEGEPSVGPLGIIPGVDQGVAILGALKIDVRSKRQFAAEFNKVDTTADGGAKQSYAATGLHFTEQFDRVGEVHAALLNIIESSKLVTIVTGLVRYDSVALTDLQIERTSQTGTNVLKFTAQARVLRIVDSETVKLPDPAKPRAKPEKSMGKQSTKATSAAELGDQRSGASKLGEVVVNAVKTALGRN